MARRITLPDRGLLYLLDRADVGPEDAAAEELVQERIAEAVGARRAHVSRAMRKLGAKGFVQPRRVHVRGEPRRRIAYFVTDEGRRRAIEVRRRLEDWPVVVVDLEGKERRRRLFEAAALLPRRPRFSDLLASVRDGRLDLREHVDRLAHLHRGRAYDVRGTLDPPHFRGRQEAIARLEKFRRDRTARVFLLLGLPGIGKTAVASRWVLGLRGRVHVLWRRLRPETAPSELLVGLAELLQAAGKPALAGLLHRPREGGADPIPILQRDLAATDAILIFDDAHAASRETAQLLARIADLPEGTTGTKLVLLARHRANLIRAEDLARGSAWEEVLGDLPPTDADDLLAAMGVAPDARPPILDRCRGHPFSLELAASGSLRLDDVRRRSAEWFAEEVVSRLPAGPRDALALAAVVGEPIAGDRLSGHAEVLLSRGVLRRTESGDVTVHDLVRDAVLRGLGPARTRANHRRAAELLAADRDPRRQLSAIRHLVSAGALRQAADLVVERGEAIIVAGYAEGLHAALEPGDWGALPRRLRSRVRLASAHALFALGRWAEAGTVYEAAAAEGRTDARLAAEALLGRGKTEGQRQSPVALPHLEAARERIERLGALSLLAETQYWIGGALQHAGRWEDARDAFERGRAVAFDAGDRRWEGLCTYGIGRIRSLREDFVGAVEEETAALRVLERGGHRIDVAKVGAGLGGNLYELHRDEEAEACLVRAAEEARATGAQDLLGYILYNQAIIRIRARRFDDALAILREALEAYEAVAVSDAACTCAAWIAHCLWRLGDEASGAEAVRHAIELADRTRSSAPRARALYQLAKAAKEAGRGQDGARYLEDAVRTARQGDLAELAESLRSAWERGA